MAEEAKDTIYIDVDDEITSVIDKVQNTNNKVVALVLPKRASVFQSVVNMKLLKRKSEEAGKNIVLVTTESSLLPLAGAVGMHVAKTLASKPEVPAAPEKVDQIVNADEDEPINLDDKEEEPVDLKSVADEPVGKLSSAPKELETIELDNEALASEGAAESKDAASKPKKAKKDKTLKVPNFEKFRLLAFICVGILILLIVLGFLLFKYLPKATIDIKTNAQNVPTNVNFTLSATATKIDAGTNTIPAKQVNESKTYTSTVNTTGQSAAKSAAGPLTFTAQSCGGFRSVPNDIPSSTTVTQGGFSYTTQSDALFGNPSTSGNCDIYTANTSIVANSAGTGSNVSTNTTFSIVKPPSQPGSVKPVSASGTASGGQDSAQVVAQADITSAENKITTNNDAVKTDLDTQLNQAGYSPLNVSFSPGSPNISPSSAVGAAANTVTVTETINCTLYGAKQADLTSLLDTAINSQVPANQSILDTGLSAANYSVGSGPSNLNLQTKAIVGPNINVKQLKNKIIGYKKADIQALIMANPNVTSVTVHYSPFFVSTVPSDTSRITINISKPTSTK